MKSFLLLLTLSLLALNSFGHDDPSPENLQGQILKQRDMLKELTEHQKIFAKELTNQRCRIGTLEQKHIQPQIFHDVNGGTFTFIDNVLVPLSQTKEIQNPVANILKEETPKPESPVKEIVAQTEKVTDTALAEVKDLKGFEDKNKEKEVVSKKEDLELLNAAKAKKEEAESFKKQAEEKISENKAEDAKKLIESSNKSAAEAEEILQKIELSKETQEAKPSSFVTEVVEKQGFSF